MNGPTRLARCRRQHHFGGAIQLTVRQPRGWDQLNPLVATSTQHLEAWIRVDSVERFRLRILDAVELSKCEGGSRRVGVALGCHLQIRPNKLALLAPWCVKPREYWRLHSVGKGGQTVAVEICEDRIRIFPLQVFELPCLLLWQGYPRAGCNAAALAAPVVHERCVHIALAVSGPARAPFVVIAAWLWCLISR